MIRIKSTNNIKFLHLVIVKIFTFCFHSLLVAQEVILPLEVKSGYLISSRKHNDSTQTSVMLETGFPKIVINESYALRHLGKLLVRNVAAENTTIHLWGTTNEIEVSYFLKDTLQFNGRKIFVDALITDFSKVESWRDLDMVFPVKDLPGVTEIDISNKYMIIDKNLE